MTLTRKVYGLMPVLKETSGRKGMYTSSQDEGPATRGCPHQHLTHPTRLMDWQPDPEAVVYFDRDAYPEYRREKRD